MAEILLTAKVVCALASAVPIVSPNYWTCFKEALDQNKLPPDPEQFIPPLKESILNKNKVSFSVNKERQKIFRGKTFVFCSDRQLKKYKNLIMAAGGTCKTVADYGRKLDEFCKPDVILMQNLSTLDSQHSQPSQLYNSVLRLMRSKGLKPIPESEIGLAILMCSVDMYCNPQYNVIENVLEGGAMSSSQAKGGEVLASETPNFGTEVSMIKTENVDEHKPVVGPALSVAESVTPHSSGSLSSMYDNRNLDETLPCGLSNNLLQDKNPVEEQVISSFPTAPTRKRSAPVEVDEPAAKKGLPQSKISSEAMQSPQPLFEKFEFTNILSPKSTSQPRPLNRTDQNKHNEPWNISVSETSKRKIVESCNSPSIGNQSKKPCLEKRPTQSVPRSIHQTPGTSKELFPVIELEEDLSALKMGTPLSNGRRPHSSGSSALEGRWSSKGGPSNLAEETDSISQNSRKDGMDGGLFASRLKGGSHESVRTFDESLPSTSKSVAKEWERGEKSKNIERLGFGGCVVVRREGLVVEQPSHHANQSTSASVVNFKKFRKVRSAGSSATTLPVIIGDSDLTVFKENTLL